MNTNRCSCCWYGCSNGVDTIHLLLLQRHGFSDASSRTLLDSCIEEKSCTTLQACTSVVLILHGVARVGDATVSWSHVLLWRLGSLTTKNTCVLCVLEQHVCGDAWLLELIGDNAVVSLSKRRNYKCSSPGPSRGSSAFAGPW